MAVEVADLVAKLRLDASGFSKGFKEADKGLLGLIAGGTALGEVLVGLGQQAFAAAKSIATFPIEAAKSAGAAAEQFSQLSQRTGIAVQSLQGLQVAMAREGLEAQSLAQGFRTLSGHMVGLASGAKESTELFTQLGISSQIVSQGTGATLAAIADKFVGMADGAEKSRFAIELFGRAGLQLIPILNQGSAGLDTAMKKASEFGLILTKVQQDDLLVFDDAMDDLGSAIKGFTAQVGAAFSPVLTALVKGMTSAVVLAKDTFNLFADAAQKLGIRLAAITSVIQLLGHQIFSFSVLSADAWQQTISQIKAIDELAASQLKAVDTSRQQSTSLDELAKAQLKAGEAVKTHTDHQKILGEQIVVNTKVQLSQLEALGKQQERMGGNIVSTARITLGVDLQEGKRQEQLGARIQEELTVSQRIAQAWIDSYNVQEDAAVKRFQAEMDAEDRAQENLGRFIVTQTQAAQQVTGFWQKQLQALVNSNAFSISIITTAWTSGIANSIVNGGNFVKQAWQATQVALIQGALNTGVQLAAEWALRAAIELGIASDTAASVAGINAAKNSAIIAGEAGTAAASVSIWAGASAAIVGWFATVAAGFTAISASLIATVTAVGTFIMGVLSAIAAALSATVFGIPFAGAILVGVALIGAALAASGAIELGDGGIVNSPTLAMIGEAGPEAVVPLGRGGFGGDQTIIVQLDARTIMQAVLRGMPNEVRIRAGAIA
jgi:hypothetical protein